MPPVYPLSRRWEEPTADPLSSPHLEGIVLRAKESIRGFIEGLPESVAAEIIVWIPDITGHYWILPAMAITMMVGALGRKSAE